MKTTRIKILRWIDSYLLFSLSLVLIVFIPLFPKIPLFDALPGYIVKVRTEDFLVGFTTFVWIFQAVRKKIQWNTSYFWLTIFYTVSGIVSIFLGIFLLQTIPFELLHIGKSGLTFFRYLEYFSVFFFLSSSIQTKKQLYITLVVMGITLLGVIGYGFGQKYLQFPLYSTMNREFSKGTKLYLQPGAKLQSTFAGHYDLAAYLVLSLPMLCSLSLMKITPKYFQKKQLLWTTTLQTLNLLGVLTLIETGSKTALAAYCLGITTVLLFYFKKIPSWKVRVIVTATAGVLGMIALTIFWTIAPANTKNNITALSQRVFSNNDLALNRPVDLEGEGHEFKKIATQSDTGETVYIEKKIESQWSENAIRYGISMGIRLDTLWPRALSGWANNPIFGSGFGTLSMLDTDAFVEADSTDNNYLRTVGETGLFGFVIFYGFVMLLIKEAWLTTGQQRSQFLQSLSIGFFGASVGILLNAIYIDVFAASKVAFSFWMLAGILVASRRVLQPNTTQDPLNTLLKIKKHLTQHLPFYTVLLIAFFTLHVRPFAQHNIIKNFDTNTTAVETITTVFCYIEKGSFDLCRHNGLNIKGKATLYTVLLVPLYKFFPYPTTFYFLNAAIFLVLLSMLYKAFAVHLVTPKKEILFHLLLLVLAANLLNIHVLPMTTTILLSLLLFPALYILLRKKISVSISISKKIPWNLASLGLVILLSIQPNFFESFKTRFRNDSQTPAFEFIHRVGEYINSFNFNNPYIITDLNPYYYDLYTEAEATIIPFSIESHQLETAQSTWGNFEYSNLESEYSSLLEQDIDLFASDYLLAQDKKTAENFNSLKDNFNLSYVLLGCNEMCNLYKVEPLTIPTSIQPTTISELSLELGDLNTEYSFNILSNTFHSELTQQNSPYNTLSFSKRLTNADRGEPSFEVFTGDILHQADEGQNRLFANTYSNVVEYPILYNPGNFGAIAEKIQSTASQTFFTDSEMFVLLTVDDNSEITEKQLISLYNDFLALEKLESIQNIFIIAHNLNWQDTSNPKNVVHILERKLTEFPNKNKFIISGYHPIDDKDISSLTGLYASTFDEKNNITYWATLTAGTEIDTYLGISINQNSQVSINQKILE